jgi:phospholipid N-methyltransferase
MWQLRYWQACGNFLRELRRDFRRTGAIAPSSRYLARAMAGNPRGPRPSCRVLEVGAGTGAITAEIAKHLRPGDQLDVVEINSHFIEFLRRRIYTEKVFQPCRRQIHLIHSPVETLPGEATYDHIVSCLPLNNFPAASVRQIFQVYQRLLVPDGTLTFFEYVGVRRLKSPFVNRQERRRLYRIGKIMDGYVRGFQFRRQRIYANLPPATVRHLRMRPTAATATSRTASW